MQNTSTLILTQALRDCPPVRPYLTNDLEYVLSHTPCLSVVLEDLEVKKDDEGEGEGDGGDEPVPGSKWNNFRNPRLQCDGNCNIEFTAMYSYTRWGGLSSARF